MSAITITSSISFITGCDLSLDVDEPCRPMASIWHTHHNIVLHVENIGVNGRGVKMACSSWFIFLLILSSLRPPGLGRSLRELIRPAFGIALQQTRRGYTMTNNQRQ
jgi:hypothetical protein